MQFILNLAEHRPNVRHKGEGRLSNNIIEMRPPFVCVLSGEATVRLENHHWATFNVPENPKALITF